MEKRRLQEDLGGLESCREDHKSSDENCVNSGAHRGMSKHTAGLFLSGSVLLARWLVLPSTRRCKKTWAITWVQILICVGVRFLNIFEERGLGYQLHHRLAGYLH